MAEPLRKTIKFFTIVLVFLALSGCNEKPETLDYVARVGNQYLTVAELERITGPTPSPAIRESAIRSWVEREALYLYAGEQGIEKSEEYIRLLEDAKRDLLAGLVKQSVFSDSGDEVTPTAVKDFYSQDSMLFRAAESGFIFESAEFLREQDAIEFRSFALASGWKQAQRVFKGKFVSFGEADYHPVSSLTSGSLMRLLSVMQNDETSIVLPVNSSFSVYRLIRYIEKGEVLPFETVKTSAADLLQANRNREHFETLINKLYSQYTIEIK